KHEARLGGLSSKCGLALIRRCGRANTPCGRHWPDRSLNKSRSASVSTGSKGSHFHRLGGNRWRKKGQPSHTTTLTGNGGRFPDGSICRVRGREVNASRLPSSATSRNGPGNSGHSRHRGRPIADLPGSLVGARLGPKLARASAEIPLPHGMSRSGLTPPSFSGGRPTLCKKKL